MITHILSSREFEVQTYSSCVGVLNLRRKYGDTFLEEACKKALEIGIHSRKGIKTILTVLNDELGTTEYDSSHASQADENVLNQFYCCHDACSKEVDDGNK